MGHVILLGFGSCFHREKHGLRFGPSFGPSFGPRFSKSIELPTGIPYLPCISLCGPGKRKLVLRGPFTEALPIPDLVLPGSFSLICRSRITRKHTAVKKIIRIFQHVRFATTLVGAINCACWFENRPSVHEAMSQAMPKCRVNFLRSL